MFDFYSLSIFMWRQEQKFERLRDSGSKTILGCKTDTWMESEYLFRTNDVIVGDVFRDKHGHRWRIIEIVLTVNPDIARTAVRNVPEWELEDNK